MCRVRYYTFFSQSSVVLLISNAYCCFMHIRVGSRVFASLAIAFCLVQPACGQRLSNSDFWHLIVSFSEESGYFPSENLVSNETGFQEVIPALTSNGETGGAYLGVGPDQNFTYISALRPKIAFIIDIRRQNMLQQLMYKALFELSIDRADFLSQLFSRPRPSGVGPDRKSV